MLAHRFVRILLGAGLLVAAGAAAAPHVTNRISSAAVVNAEITRLIAPISGIADASLPAPGTLLGDGEARPLVHRPAPDARERHRLQHDLAQVRAQLDRARAASTEIGSLEQVLARRTERFAIAVQDRLRAELEEARAEHAATLAGADRARAELGRLAFLRQSGLAAPPMLDAQTAAVRQAEALAEVQAARIARLEVEAGAARAGINLRDGHNDVPYSQQQRDRLLLERLSLDQRIAEAEAREAALLAAIAAEATLTREQDSFIHTVHGNPLVWERHATPGTPVRVGDVLIDLVHCDALFVEVGLAESAFAAIAPGDQANVAFRGGVALTGTVRSVRGAGARPRAMPLAADRPGEAGARITVEVMLPPGAASVLGANAEHDFCGIGRLAEVSFPIAMGPGMAAAAAATRRVLDAGGTVLRGARDLAGSMLASTVRAAVPSPLDLAP